MNTNFSENKEWVVTQRKLSAKKSRQRGFTLIELLTVVAIVGLLAAIALSSFGIYRQNAAYAVVTRVGADARQDVEISSTNQDEALPSFILSPAQTSPGPVQNVNAKKVLKALQIPRQATFQARFDSTCQSQGCESAFVEIHHLQSKKYLQLLRAGDGLWVPIEQTGP